MEVVAEGVVPLILRRHHRDRPLHLGLALVMAALLLIPLGLRLPTIPSLILCISPYDGGGHVRERLRPKESDEVNILAFPTGSQWRAWRANTFASIVSAAGRQGDLGSKLGLERRDGRPSRAGIPM